VAVGYGDPHSAGVAGEVDGGFRAGVYDDVGDEFGDEKQDGV
jgi:hypothetical protein